MSYTVRKNKTVSEEKVTDRDLNERLARLKGEDSAARTAPAKPVCTFYTYMSMVIYLLGLCTCGYIVCLILMGVHLFFLHLGVGSLSLCLCLSISISFSQLINPKKYYSCVA